LRAAICYDVGRSLGEELPSQQQLKWSELRVGVTVIVAVATLMVLIFLMGGAAGIFSSKITLYAYFDNAEGLKVGAPVRLQGVDIGNVRTIRIVPDRPSAPVQVTMRVSTKYQFMVRKDSKATIETAGVLGESFIDIDSRAATKGQIQNGEELVSFSTPGLDDVVRSGQTTLANLDILVKRLDRIVSSIESGEGTLGEFIKDPSFFNKANDILGQIQKLVGDVSNGKGSIGKLLADDTLYNKLNSDVDKLSHMVDDIQAGKGSLGKFIKDDALYNNANQTLAKSNKLMDDVNAGRGTFGMLAKDEKFPKKLNDTIDRLNATLQKLESGNGSASKFLNDPSLYNNTDQMLVETRGLIKAIREDPKKYLTIHFRIF
jgi:phospholipid/cholesterol/gamma-HCH transport system substrate-binding protein